jgi:hypothetical protein
MAPCPSCGHENREGAKSCGGCAARIAGAPACPHCAASNPAGQRFCDSCGRDIDPFTTCTPTPTASPALPESFAGGRHHVERFLGEGDPGLLGLGADIRSYVHDRDSAALKSERGPAQPTGGLGGAGNSCLACRTRRALGTPASGHIDTRPIITP